MPQQTRKVETKHRCTACSSQIRSSFDAFLHPLLKVLVCKKCHTDYGTGDFSLFNDPEVGPGVDENGDDNYCRWCVDGGDLFACGNGELDEQNRCHYAFCTDCIKRNCPDDEVLNSNYEQDFKWPCFACKPEKLKKLRQEAQEIILALSSKDLKRDKEKPRETLAPVVNEVQTPTQAPKKRKTESTTPLNGDSAPKEPEAASRPPVAPPRPPESALRRLSKKSAPPEAPKNPTSKPSPNPLGPAMSTSSTTSTNGAPTTQPSTMTVPANTAGSTPTPASTTIYPASSNTPKAPVRSLPSSVNNTKVKLPSLSSSLVQTPPQLPPDTPKLNGSLLKSRPLSKQLKASNEQVRPSCKVTLSEADLLKRLDNFSQVKVNCIKELDTKFQNVLEMFSSKQLSQNKAILRFEIEDLEKPIQEFISMLRDLKSLYHSQI